MTRSTRVLFLCNDAIGPRMAGPGIRYWELARVLATAGLEVTLAVLPFVPDVSAPEDAPFSRFRHCRDDAEVRALAQESDVIVTQGILLSTYPYLAQLGIPLALDFYIPFLLERLHVDVDTAGAEHLFMHEDYRRALGLQVRAADFIFCASEMQRDYYLGALMARGRVNPYTHADDPTLRKLIDVVPFGLPGDPPRHKRQVLKGVVPGIGADDKVLLWGGGIWNWLDAPTLIRAMARLSESRPDVKLFFMGVQRPNPLTDKMQAGVQAMALSQALGLTGRTVFFNDWVPYEERADYLLEADVGVSLHRDHLETRFSFRTRFLDYVWAGLPVIATRGDVLSEQVERRGWGRVVEPGDVDGVAEAILRLVDTPDLRAALRPGFERAASAYRWEVVARPLLEFCAAPRIAPDKAHLRLGLGDVGPTPVWRLPEKAWRALRVGGLHGLLRQVNAYRRWLLNRWGRG